MYLCSNERLYFLKRCVDGLLETVWYGKSLFGSNNHSGDWFIVRKTVVHYFRILGLVSVFSKYTVNHLTQPVRGERFLAGKGHIIHIQSEFAATLLCRMQYSISIENQPYLVLCTLSPDGCTAHVPDFPKITTQAPTLDAALLEVKQQIQKALRQYKNPPIPTKQEQIVVPQNSVLVLVKAG